MNINSLIDKRLGPIKEIELLQRLPEEPTNLVTYSARVNDISQYLNWRPDLVGSGTSLSTQYAYNAAVGEAIERYCGNHVPENLYKSSLLEIKNEDFLNPNIMYQFSKSQYNSNGFPFSLYKENENIEWTSGISLTNNRKYWIPAELVYLNYSLYRNNNKSQRPILLSGISTGQGLSNAATSSLLEIIERDTTMLWWLGRQPQTKIIVSDNSRIQKEILKNIPKSLEINWYLLPSDFSVYTVACSLVDHDNQLFNVGFATRFNPETALEKSAAEAFQLRRFSLDLLNGSSSIWRKSNYKKLLGIKSYRQDRQYSKSFTGDWSDMKSLLHNVQYFLDPSIWSRAKNRFITDRSVQLKSLDLINPNEKLNYLIDQFQTNGLSAYLVDVTTNDIKSAGFNVVRVISPEACPNMPTALPMLENKRLLNVAKFNKGTTIREKFDLSPLPHS